MDLESSRPNKLNFIVGLLLFIFVVCLVWLFQHSFIQVNANNHTGTTTFSFKNQGSDKNDEIKSSGSSIKKLVTKGRYLVEARTRYGSFIKPVSTKGFLQTSEVSGKLKPESGREFVGINPDPCMYYTGEVLYSTACSQPLNDIKVHVPANSYNPTFVKPLESNFVFEKEGFVTFQDKSYLVGRIPDIESPKPASLYPITNPLGPNSEIKLVGLRDGLSYQVLQLGRGLVALDQNYSEVFVYDSGATLNNKFIIKSPGGKYKPKSFTASGNRFAIEYFSGPEDTNLDSETSDQGNTIISVYNSTGSRANNYQFNGSYVAVELCGVKNLCLLKGRDLTVYNVSSEKQKKLFSVPGVNGITLSGQDLVYATSKEVIEFKLNEMVGSINYSFADYDFCGFGESATPGYLVCVIDPGNNRYALYVDTRRINIDSVDKKVAELVNSSSVDTVSPYKNYLYINPEVGELSYNSAEKGFTYNKDFVQKSNTEINRLVNGLNLKGSGYTVVNPYANY